MRIFGRAVVAWYWVRNWSGLVERQPAWQVPALGDRVVSGKLGSDAVADTGERDPYLPAQSSFG
jgi:hypothetical protein